jgi:hypothetical protein
MLARNLTVGSEARYKGRWCADGWNLEVGSGWVRLTATAMRFLWGAESESSWSAMVMARVSCEEDKGKRRSVGEGKYSG